jgi:hypothetical protein
MLFLEGWRYYLCGTTGSTIPSAVHPVPHLYRAILVLLVKALIFLICGVFTVSSLIDSLQFEIPQRFGFLGAVKRMRLCVP